MTILSVTPHAFSGTPVDYSAQREPSSTSLQDSLLAGYLPKEDLGIPEFLERHPGCDGGGIIVAVLDTGLDLLNPGLQVTPSGRPKIIDYWDATDTGRISLPGATVTTDSLLQGFTGRILSLGAHRSDDDTYFLGRFEGRRLFPKGLSARLSEKRKRDFEKAMDAIKLFKPDEKEDEEDELYRLDEDEGDEERTLRLYWEERKRIDQFARDIGPVYDLVAFRWQDEWACLIDTDRDGDLGEEKILLDYPIRRDVAILGEEENLGAAVRIEDGGRTVSLLFDGGGHGSHVAGIIGGYFGEDDPLNGLAPGVQFISVIIGNTRMGGATTHNAIMKGIDYAARQGARVINISFGGSSFFDDGTEVTARFIDEATRKYCIHVVTSAGNSGPGLSTVGSPATSRLVYSIGAGIGIKTQMTNYGTLEPRREEIFGFSSRGPLLGGGQGIHFLAPGAAVSTLPGWLLSRGENWNGTSMASPQMAGCLALLLCAAESMGLGQDLPYQHVRRALRATARPLPGFLPIEQGAGVPDLPRAAELLKTIAKSPDIVDYRVSIRNPTGTGCGIYRRRLDAREPLVCTARVTPDFPEEGESGRKANFSRIVRLEASAPWIGIPPQMHLGARGTTLRMRIDPRGMTEGLHSEVIRAYDVTNAGTGAEFEIPVTVILPQSPSPRDTETSGSWNFRPGDVRRLFVNVPDGASHVTLRCKEVEAKGRNRYTVILADASLWKDPEQRGTKHRLDLGKGDEREVSRIVEAGTVLEVTAFAQWIANEPGKLDWGLRFSGIRSPSDNLNVGSGDSGCALPLEAPLGDTGIALTAVTDHEVVPVAMEWTFHPDSLYPEVLHDETLATARGRSELYIDRPGRVALHPLYEPEMEDFLDDAFFAIRDPGGREIARGWVSGSEVSWDVPAPGLHTVDCTVFSRGRDFFDDWQMLRFELRYPHGPATVPVFSNTILGEAGGDGRINDVTLLQGEKRRLFLRTCGLPAGKIFTGKVTVRDGKDGKNVLLSLPLRVDRRPSSPDNDEIVKLAAEELYRKALVEIRRIPATGTSVAEGVRLIERSLAVDPEHRAMRVEFLLAEVTAGPMGKEEWVDRAAGLLIEREKSLRDLLKDCREGDRLSRYQRDLAGVLLHRALLLVKEKKARNAEKVMEEARSLAPRSPELDRVVSLLYLEEGKILDALKALRGALEKEPFRADLERALIELYLTVGWNDLALEEIRRWPIMYPLDRQDFEDLHRKWAESRKSGVLRSVPAVALRSLRTGDW